MKKNKKFNALLNEYFLVYGIIPAFAISILLLSFVFLFQRYSFKSEIREFNRQAAKGLESELDRHREFLEGFAAMEETAEYLRHAQNPSQLYEKFYDYNRSTPLVCVLNFLDADGETLSTSVKLPGQYSEMRIRMIADRVDKQSPGILLESNLLEYPSGSVSVMTFGTAVKDGGQTLGYILLHVLEEGIREVIKPRDMLWQITVDKFDRIISIQNDLEHRLNDRYLPDENDRYYVVSRSVPGFGLTIYTAGSWNTYQRSYVMTMLFSILVLALLAFLVQNISRKVSRRVTEPIQDLVQAFSHLKTGAAACASYDSHIEEFRFLAAEYNHTLEQLNLLMKRNEELSEIRRIAEIKQLEAQFDPHFFLNMLETLRYMSLMSRDEAEKLIVSLSGILRYSLYNKDQFSSVGDDMKYVEDYLFLQKSRIGSNFSYRVDLDESALGLVIPKLLIQPLIENSIKHGYQGLPGFYVELTILRKGGDLFLQVSDNGKGISKDETKRLWEMLNDAEAGDHIGLINLHKRLIYMYGEGFGVQEIDGDSGFRVTVRMKGEGRPDELQSFGG